MFAYERLPVYVCVLCLDIYDYKTRMWVNISVGVKALVLAFIFDKITERLSLLTWQLRRPDESPKSLQKNHNPLQSCIHT